MDEASGFHQVDTSSEPHKPARPAFLPRTRRREPLDAFEVAGLISAGIGIAVLASLLAGWLG